MYKLKDTTTVYLKTIIVSCPFIPWYTLVFVTSLLSYVCTYIHIFLHVCSSIYPLPFRILFGLNRSHRNETCISESGSSTIVQVEKFFDIHLDETPVKLCTLESHRVYHFFCDLNYYTETLEDMELLGRLQVLLINDFVTSIYPSEWIFLFY